MLGAAAPASPTVPENVTLVRRNSAMAARREVFSTDPERNGPLFKVTNKVSTTKCVAASPACAPSLARRRF